MDRLEERKQSAAATAEGSSQRRRRRRRIILAAAAPVWWMDGWMDVWLRECDSQVFFFQQASSRRAGRPSISFLAQESSLKHGKLDWLGRGPM